MEDKILIKQIETINNYLDFERTLNIMYKYYNRETFERLYKESENELKGTDNEHNIKKLHEILNRKQNNYYKYLGLNNLMLHNNENYFNHLTELMETLETNNKRFEYLYELEQFNSYGYYLYFFYENHFQFNIKSEYHIIIDYEKRAIYNLNYDNITEILTELLNTNEIEKNDNILFEIEKLNNENINLILKNNKYNLKDFNLKLSDFETYNINDNYICFDLIRGKGNTFNNLDFDLKNVVNEIITDNEEIINIIINEL